MVTADLRPSAPSFPSRAPGSPSECKDSRGWGDRMLALPRGLGGAVLPPLPPPGEATPFTKNAFHGMISSDWGWRTQRQ